MNQKTLKIEVFRKMLEKVSENGEKKVFVNNS